MFWWQGGQLVDDAGRPVFGEPPNREKMIRVLSFLRETLTSGASPRAVLGHNDYQQLTSAAIAGDAAMFLGGNWQVREAAAGGLGRLGGERAVRDAEAGRPGAALPGAR